MKENNYMSTYPKKNYISAEDTIFQDIYDSIINELINLENLAPDKSRLSILESILKQLCKCINSDTAFVFKLLNQNIYELKFRYCISNFVCRKAPRIYKTGFPFFSYCPCSFKAHEYNRHAS